ISLRIFRGRAEQGDEIELMARKDGLHPVEEPHEKHIAFPGHGGPGLRHEADHSGRALSPGATRLIGHITHGRRRLEHALARRLVHIRLAIERAGDGADRNVELLRQASDTGHACWLPPRALAGSRNVYDSPLTRLRFK